MTEPPTIDDRSRDDLLAELTERADRYVDGLDGTSTDMASVLLQITSEFGSETIQRLNGLPPKHRTAFLETLGVQRRPPQAARLPLSVEVSAELDRNVTIPGGTQALATSSDDESVLFEVPHDRRFEATPASLTHCYAVDPAADRLVSHESLTLGDSTRLFSGESHQQHAIYFGDESLFQLAPGSVIELDVRGSIDANTLADSVCWEYYGVDEDGGEGWHRLQIADADSGFGTDDHPRSRRLDPQSTPAPSEGYSVRLRLPNEFAETTVGGIESRWIRGRLETAESACFATQIESVQAQVGQSTDASPATPDAGFTNDVPLSFGDGAAIYPFGQLPQPSATLYLAAEDALSKPGGLVALAFHRSPSGDTGLDAESATETTESVPSEDDSLTADFGALSGPPEISWEYWNGTGWAGLSIQSDTTDRLRTAGEIKFEVPENIESTAVSGHEARWIRARLVGGSYGQPLVSRTEADADGGVNAVDPPEYDRLTLSYDHRGSSVAHVMTENNAVRATVSETANQYQPFRRLAEDRQTLYFGFDAALQNGPIPLFVPLVETTVPRGFDPGVQWEYCTDPDTDSWSRLAVDDGTDGLTERGIVSLRFPEPTTEHQRFGKRAHWIRAVVTEDAFATGRSESQLRPSVADNSVDSRPRPPVVQGLYPNTQWADNARTIENEILGSSDGSANQTFACAHGPLIDWEIWVDEAGSLSAAKREQLRDTEADRIEVVTDEHGDLEQFWVRWTAVENFIGLDSDSRRYRCDRAAGTITFGDGDNGRLPPRGHDSVRATYTTGGGTDGNVPAGAVTDLKTPISLVESVDNPLPADGGAGIESMEAVGSRAASEIKTRGKAVTATDFEQVAARAVRKLATVACRPHLGPDGDRKPGWITLLIVPESDRDRPMPSTELKHRVRRAVAEVAPARLTNSDESRIVVRGPRYVAVSVDVSVQSVEESTLSGLTDEIESTLDAYLHPLEGGPDGTGWPVGESPTVDSLASLVNSVDGVDDTTELSATMQIGDRSVRVAHSPSLPADGLVCAGSHNSTVQVGENR